MSQRDILKTLEAVRDGELSPQDAMTRLKMEPFQDLGFAKIDHHRELRQGVAEVIYGAGKTARQVTDIAEAMLKHGQKTIMMTRISPEKAEEIGKSLPIEYNSLAQIALLGRLPEPDGDGTIVVATGGTSDMPVAEEAAMTAEALGNRVIRLYDVGVSGVHRLLHNMEHIMSARCIVAVAGMEGALPSVIGGLADCPVIAVPTSVGYGASLGGIAALLSMLNSCASGVSVVNIDNGFGGGYLASMINHLGGKAE
ncbi:MAG: nickel pincer cofactor biosynthesis protein LarB [Oscillospiraceae bacterium]|nr:nickel pincer cofactor biosynthesis protein LarB [Oscillospiraceae bacterium]